MLRIQYSINKRGNQAVYCRATNRVKAKQFDVEGGIVGQGLAPAGNDGTSKPLPYIFLIALWQ